MRKEKRDQVKSAVAEAKRFIQRAEVFLSETAGTYVIDSYDDPHKKFTYHTSSPRASAAMRRASLDLSNSLADMRKS